jgi:hypothetical protein
VQTVAEGAVTPAEWRIVLLQKKTEAQLRMTEQCQHWCCCSFPLNFDPPARYGEEEDEEE